MPVKEESFRIGCGRYLQGAGYISRVGEEVKRLGMSAIVVGGQTALGITQNKIEESLRENNCKYLFIKHTGTCNEQRALEIAKIAVSDGYEVIVGVGGGVIMDFSKLCAYYANTPVVNIPTSSATCAAYTPLTVRYTPEGDTIGSLHYQDEVNCVIADTAVIATQPTRLLLAGAFDALAKFVEIKQRFKEDITEDYPIGLDYAYELSKYSYALIDKKISKGISDMQKGEITPDFENLIFTNIAATGVISGIARGSNQCALAHKFYEITRVMFNKSARPYLHGEIVGVGLLLQNHFNGEVENNDKLLDLMKKHDMPCRVSDVGIELSEEAFFDYYEKLKKSTAINAEDELECERLRKALRYLWDVK